MLIPIDFSDNSLYIIKNIHMPRSRIRIVVEEISGGIIADAIHAVAMREGSSLVVQNFVILIASVFRPSSDKWKDIIITAYRNPDLSVCSDHNTPASCKFFNSFRVNPPLSHINLPV